MLTTDRSNFAGGKADWDKKTFCRSHRLRAGGGENTRSSLDSWRPEEWGKRDANSAVNFSEGARNGSGRGGPMRGSGAPT